MSRAASKPPGINNIKEDGMKDSLFTVRSNREIAYLMYEMRLSGPAADCMRPDTFVNLKIEGNYLRRPISVCDASENELVLLYKVVGEGTKKMAEMTEGDTIMILTGLGNGYDTSKSGDKPLLLGGGSGVASSCLMLPIACSRLTISTLYAST